MSCLCSEWQRLPEAQVMDEDLVLLGAVQTQDAKSLLSTTASAQLESGPKMHPDRAQVGSQLLYWMTNEPGNQLAAHPGLASLWA